MMFGCFVFGKFCGNVGVGVLVVICYSGEGGVVVRDREEERGL